MMARETFLEEEGLNLSIDRLREGKGCGSARGGGHGRETFCAPTLFSNER
jgi:hypothetical protein